MRRAKIGFDGGRGFRDCWWQQRWQAIVVQMDASVIERKELRYYSRGSF